jgi:integrase
MLTETQIRNAKPGEKPRKIFDGGGLYLEVAPNGSRWWRLKYRIHGVEKRLSLGVYPDITLKRARERCQDARRLIAEGIDPSAQRKAEKAAAVDTFEALAREYFDVKRNGMAEKTFTKRQQRFEKFAFPKLGSRPIAKITAPEFLAMLKTVEARGTNETAHRLRSESGQVFRYAIATGRAERDITADLRGALAPVRVTHHAAIVEPERIGELLRAIDNYRGHPVTEAALKLAPLLFVRPGELRLAEWADIRLEGTDPEYRIPAARMKMREQHVVPLSRQAVAILEGLRGYSGDTKYVFPSVRTFTRPISDNTINASLRRLGYSCEQMTGHGFRTIASTCLNELGYPPDIIELQLAHAERNDVRAAYNRASRLSERRKMMQEWADYLDTLRRGANGDSIGQTAVTW